MANSNVVKMNEVLFSKLGEVVSGDERTDFLSRNLNNLALAYISFEQMIYKMAGEMSEDYKEGVWVCVQCKNGKGFFIYPSSGEFSIANANYNSQYTVDNKTFGLLVTMMVSSHGSFIFQNNEAVCEAFGRNYQELRSQVFGLIDKLCYGDDEAEESPEITVTTEQISELTELSKAIYNYLD